MAAKDDNDSKYRAPALEKGLDIIELLAGSVDGHSQSAIARALERSQSEIYRMLTTLVRRGYVVRSSENDNYTLSLKMFALSQRQPPIGRLLEVASSRMRAVARKAWQSCHLGMESNGDIVVVASADSPGNWGLALRVGSVIGLENTGTGRVLAAFRTDEAVEAMMDQHRLSVGEPPLDRAALRSHVARIREQGFERMPSATTVGVTNLAYPVVDPDGVAVAVVSCPFLERIDAHAVPSLEEVHEMYVALAADLSAYFQGASARADLVSS